MLSNYVELQTEIADTLHRDDLTIKIPVFIKLFEKRINRSLRTLQNETSINTALIQGSRSIVLPSLFNEIIDITAIIFGIPTIIIPSTTVLFDDGVIYDTFPRYFNISNGFINFDNNADRDYDITIRYYKGFDLATDNTNWLLDNHPDLYLYGSLAASSIYIDNDERLPLWGQLAASALEEINDQAYQSRNKSSLVTELNQFSDSRFYNIITGTI